MISASASKDILALLPHGIGLHFIDRIQSSDDSELVATLNVSASCAPMGCSGGGVCSSVAIEYVGQAIASHMAWGMWKDSEGFRLTGSARLSNAFLVKVKDLSLAADQFALGSHLRVVVRLDSKSDSTALYVASVFDLAADLELASGKFLVHVPKKIPFERELTR